MTTNFWSMPEHNPTTARFVAERLHQKGRLTFAEFMDLVLYDPQGGYYAGFEALPLRDYRTSPAVHPLFGALIAHQLEQMWHVLGEPEHFVVVEVGAGEGKLCRDIMDSTRQVAPEFGAVLHYVIVEPREVMQQRQRMTIGPEWAPQVRWVTGSATALPARVKAGCLLSNELVDAFPVHRVVVSNGVLYESYVVEREEGLAEELGEPARPELGEYFDRLGLHPPEGCLVEVNLAGARFLREAAKAIERGFLLTIDYGYAAEELYAPNRPSGTLRCYHQHRYNDDPYRRLGRQDITTHVDFSTLVVVGREAGLRLTGLTSQRQFLLNLGLEAYASKLERENLPAGRLYDNNFAIRELISKAGLGAFRVLVQHKGVHDPELDGFNPCNDRKRRLIASSGPSFLPLSPSPRLEASDW